MEKEEVKKIFEKVVKHHKRQLKLVFSENYPNPNKNGGIFSSECKIVINWTKMKDVNKEKIINFFCHEIGHDIIFWWVMKQVDDMDKKVDEIRDMVRNYKEGEKMADYLGNMFYKNKVKQG